MANQPSSPPVKFEEALDRLQAVVRDLEDGELGLDEALARYEEGIRLLRQCHDLLQRAERKIELLTGTDSSGNPICTPLDDTALSLDETAERRSGLRPTKGSRYNHDVGAADMDEGEGSV